MKIQIHSNTLQLLHGDITKQQTDVIVNAANGTLLGGGGVDGAIHQAAGPELLEECKQIREQQLNGEHLQTGEAIITKGYQLPASYVIHTVGPIWDPAKESEQRVQLANCYWNSLRLAEQYTLKSIAFPSISTGVYRFPIEKASNIALKTIQLFLRENEFGKVVITLFSEEDLDVYKAMLNKLQ